MARFPAFEDRFFKVIVAVITAAAVWGFLAWRGNRAALLVAIGVMVLLIGLAFWPRNTPSADKRQ